jgi:hypothetical protein
VDAGTSTSFNVGAFLGKGKWFDIQTYEPRKGQGALYPARRRLFPPSGVLGALTVR